MLKEPESPYRPNHSYGKDGVQSKAIPVSPGENDGRQSTMNQKSIPSLPKSPSKPGYKEKSSHLQRNSQNKYLKVSEFIKVTTTSSSAKPKNKKGLLNGEGPRYYEQMSLKQQVYLPSSGSTLTDQRSAAGKVALSF